MLFLTAHQGATLGREKTNKGLYQVTFRQSADVQLYAAVATGMALQQSHVSLHGVSTVSLALDSHYALVELSYAHQPEGIQNTMNKI